MSQLYGAVRHVSSSAVLYERVLVCGFGSRCGGLATQRLNRAYLVSESWPYVDAFNVEVHSAGADRIAFGDPYLAALESVPHSSLASHDRTTGTWTHRLP